MRFSFLIPAALAASVFAGQAIAADLVVADAPVAVPAAGFDWEGGYAGLHGGAFLWPDYETEYGLAGAQVGYNFLASESILAGIEASAEYLSGTNGDFVHVAVGGRLGVLATDSVLIYGLGQLGVEFTKSNDKYTYYGLGAGVEVAATDSISVKGELIGGNQFDNVDSGFKSVTGTVGINFHF